MARRSSSHLAAAASLAAVVVVAVTLAATSAPLGADAFTVPTSAATNVARSSSLSSPSNNNNMRFASGTPLYAEETKEANAAFMPLSSSEEEEGDDDDDDVDIDLETVEMLGKGAAKAKRGKRKGGPTAPKAGTTKASVTLTPEEVFYEGPPAITETIVPTISILTVVGIVPAIASWSRQAWVRYKVTSRRIRVTSGIGGKDMAEIVYPDIVELRTAKRLFGDGDVVAFLRDGAKFEMRNVPNFDETMEFILSKVDADVAAQYRSKGDVTRQ